MSGLMTAPATYGIRCIATLLLAAVIVAICPVSAPPAHAVNPQGAITVTPTTLNAGAPADYTIARFRVPGGETVTGYTVTFPGDAYVRNATSPDGTVAYLSDQTVRVTCTPPIVGNQPRVTLTILNVRNPSTPGAITLVFHRQGLPDQPFDLGAAGTIPIVPAPYLSMTITTPNAGQTVDFGAVDPGVTSSAGPVELRVRSSAQYTITRTITDPAGTVAKLGLAVSGVPVGVLQAAAPTPRLHSDVFSVTPPWTTDPEIPFTATVIYTVTQ